MSKQTTQTGQGDQTMSKTRLFLPIRKVDEEQRLVYGVITEEVLDKSGEVMDYEGSKPLFEKWSQGIAQATEGKSFGNVRVMHTNKVAGVLNQELVFDDEAKTIEACAKVIDDNEWAMVMAGGYTGFSIGGRYQKRWEADGQKRFIAEPVEVSLVDNPCVPTATFSLLKADGAEEEVEFQLWSPTSEQVATRAGELAKAAGGEAVWTDYIEPARDELLKAHAEESDEDEEDSEKKADDETSTDEEKEADKSDDDSKTGDEDDGKEKEDDEDDADTADKAVLDSLAQKWQTTDGRTFDKKAEAAKHQSTLAGKAQDPLSAAIAGVRKALSADDTETSVDPQLVTILETGEEVSKWHGILTGAREHLNEHLVAKGLYQVGRLAELMETLGYVCASSCWEREAEKDQSPVPEMLANGLVTLGAALVTMAQEEVSEMIAEMQTRGLDVDTIISTLPEVAAVKASADTLAKSDDVNKAGARHNKTDKQKLQEVYRILKDLGVEDDETTEKLAKATGLVEENERLTKVINDAVPAIEQLKKDVELLKAQPMPSAGKTHVVAKGQEDGRPAPGQPETLEDLVKVHGAENLARAAIKVAQQTPMSMVHRG